MTPLQHVAEAVPARGLGGPDLESAGGVDIRRFGFAEEVAEVEEILIQVYGWAATPTHILKKTGSYEQASYAIQDTPEMVAQHYGRFLPQDKAAIAAQVLNRVWDAA